MTSDEVKHIIRQTLTCNAPLIDQEIDTLCGLDISREEGKIRFSELNLEHPNENLWENQEYQRWTPYDLIRTFCRIAKPEASDVFYDIGAGYGRVIIYAAIATQARCKGVEIVGHRAAVAMQIKARLDITNLDIIQANASQADISDGTIFFLFNPFSNETLKMVGKKLAAIPRKNLKIITVGQTMKEFFDSQNWLELTFSTPKSEEWWLNIYTTKSYLS